DFVVSRLLSLIKHIIRHQRLNPRLPEIRRDLCTMVSRVIDYVKENITNAISEEITTSGLVLNHGAKIKPVKNRQCMIVVFLLNSFKHIWCMDIPHTKRIYLSRINSIIPNPVGIEDVTEKLDRSLGNFVPVFENGFRQLDIEMMAVFK